MISRVTLPQRRRATWMPRLVVRTLSVPELVSSQSTTIVVFQGAADFDLPKIEMNVRQEPVEPLIPAPGGGEGVARAAQRVLAEKRMLEGGRERRQHRLGIAFVDGGEQRPDAAADDGVIHGFAPWPRSVYNRSMIELYRIEFNDATEYVFAHETNQLCPHALFAGARPRSDRRLVVAADRPRPLSRRRALRRFGRRPRHFAQSVDAPSERADQKRHRRAPRLPAPAAAPRILAERGRARPRAGDLGADRLGRPLGAPKGRKPDAVRAQNLRPALRAALHLLGLRRRDHRRCGQDNRRPGRRDEDRNA